MQDHHFTAVNTPSATDTKDGSACEYLQSLEIHVTALDWIMLLRSMVGERILKECEGIYLECCKFVQFGRHVYNTALRYCMSNEIKQRHILQNCNLHRLRVFFLYAQTALNMSAFGFKLNSFGIARHNSNLNFNCRCRKWQNIANLQKYDLCEYSCLQWICTVFVCWSCKPLPQGDIQINNMGHTYNVTSWIFRANLLQCKASIHSGRVLELHVTVSCI